MKFVHLHTHSHYSLLDGLAKVDDLIGQAKKLGMEALALTDHGNLYGSVEFYKKAKKASIKPILGVEVYLAPRSRLDKTPTGERYYHLTLLCENLIGWKNLLKLVTKSNLEGFYYKPRVDKELLREHHEGLIALSGCFSGDLIQTIIKSSSLEPAEQLIADYKEIFGANNFFLELTHHPKFDPRNYQKVRTAIKELGKKTNTPIVATQDIHYLRKEDAQYHDILLAVQTGNKLSDGDRLTLKNDDFSMTSAEEMAERFADVPEAVKNTALIAKRCNVELTLGKNILPHFPLPEGETANSYLRHLVTERAPNKLGQITPAISERLEYELSVIEKTGFADYFLIVQDFINWAKERGIVVGPGRGSAAGSLVSYVISITDVDSIKYNIIFERFLNPERIQMPDIDVDITDVRRDEVMGYLREKYGDDHVAHIITFGTMAARAAVRDVGRALGITYALCDQISKLIPFGTNLGEALTGTAELTNLYQKNPDAKRIIDAAKHLEGVARHASIHACGIVISKEPLTDYLALQYAPQSNRTIITQIEMHGVEDLGLLKIDLLGLKNLTIIENAIRLIRDSGKGAVDMSTIPYDDAAVFALLQSGETTGIFQVESAGMRRYLKELKPTELEDIISMIALYRPGPIDSIPKFIEAKHGRTAISYLHPLLKPILQNTYGVIVTQDQVLEIARSFAGLTYAEADILRKAVGKKIKSLLDEQKNKFIQGAITARGIESAIAEQVWEFIEPFARYGFNRAHGVCYALIVYRTAYLKVHYPLEFATSLLNADAGDVERIGFLVSDIKKMGIAILPPDINHSTAVFAPEGAGIRFGLSAIKNVGSNVVQAIIDNRQQHGAFTTLSNLLNRIQHKDLNKKSLEALIRCGALECFNIERNRLLVNIDDIIKFSGALRRSSKSNQSGLFGAVAETASFKLGPATPATPAEKLSWEKELLGLYISDHPLNRHRTQLASAGIKAIKELLEIKSDQERFNIGGLITSAKKIVTKTGKPMVFARLEDFGHAIEVIVFPNTYDQTAALWREGAIIIVNGKLSLRDSEPKFICDRAMELG